MAVRKYAEVKAEKGYAPDDRVESFMGFGKNGDGPAWTFVLLARLRGWDVSDPHDNGAGYPIVTVWKRGPDDQPLYLASTS